MGNTANPGLLKKFKEKVSGNLVKIPTTLEAALALGVSFIVVIIGIRLKVVMTAPLIGGTFFTNINGKTLDDPSFQCVFETARKLDVPLFVHPTTPSPADAF